MRPPNHIDGRRKLTPAAYLPSGTFGRNPKVRPLLPPGGDVASMRIAVRTHALLCRHRAAGHRPSGAAMGRDYGFSRNVFSEVKAGRRWAGEAVLAALLTVQPPPRTTP